MSKDGVITNDVALNLNLITMMILLFVFEALGQNFPKMFPRHRVSYHQSGCDCKLFTGWIMWPKSAGWFWRGCNCYEMYADKAPLVHVVSQTMYCPSYNYTRCKSELVAHSGKWRTLVTSCRQQQTDNIVHSPYIICLFAPLAAKSCLNALSHIRDCLLGMPSRL